METKDLFYIGAIAYLAYLLSKRNTLINNALKRNSLDPSGLKNGGLNLGQNMDLPNLTPTPEDGMSTEESLNQGNISPLIKEDNEPTQIFGASLPFLSVVTTLGSFARLLFFFSINAAFSSAIFRSLFDCWRCF